MTKCLIMRNESPKTKEKKAVNVTDTAVLMG